MADRPSKLYFTISEVAEVTGVKPHVLRYWESEFPTLRPRKTRSGSRRYRQRDIDEILAIKQLLYEEGFRISGARKIRRQAHVAMDEVESRARPQLRIPMQEQNEAARLATIRDELNQILALVKDLGHQSADRAEDTDAGEPLKEAEAEA
jgi:DNA-binding transcriptional MerR regulator